MMEVRLCVLRLNFYAFLSQKLQIQKSAEYGELGN